MSAKRLSSILSDFVNLPEQTERRSIVSFANLSSCASRPTGCFFGVESSSSRDRFCRGAAPSSRAEPTVQRLAPD
eukprot:11739478-Alexandrium_andersonii.AAC.1